MNCKGILIHCSLKIKHLQVRLPVHKHKLNNSLEHLEPPVSSREVRCYHLCLSLGKGCRETQLYVKVARQRWKSAKARLNSGTKLNKQVRHPLQEITVGKINYHH